MFSLAWVCSCMENIMNPIMDMLSLKGFYVGKGNQTAVYVSGAQGQK